MVEACDNGNPRPLCDTTNIRINVVDFNDEPPRFDQSTYMTDICFASAMVGTDLVQPVATDGDSGSNAELVYSLETSSSLFNIDSTNGRFSLAQAPTSSDIATHTLTVMARDRGENPLSSTAQVLIRILNCSETNFYFREPFHYFEIEEGENSFVGRIGTLRLDLPITPGVVVAFSPDPPSNPFTNVLNVRVTGIVAEPSVEQFFCLLV